MHEIRGLIRVLEEVKSSHSLSCLKSLDPVCEWVKSHEADLSLVRDLERFYDKARHSDMEECIFLNLVLDKIGLMLKYMEDSSDESLDRMKIRELSEPLEQARNQISLK